MKIKAIYIYQEGYLPTKRCRKLRYREATDTIEVELKEVTAEEAPIAVEVTTPCFETGKTTKKTEEYRIFNGSFYKKAYLSEYESKQKGLYPLEKLIESFEKFNYYSDYGKEVEQSKILKKINDYILIDNVIWVKTGEPRYCIVTFGLGRNHGSTGFFCEHHYNPNISKNNYFNALERDKALEYGRDVAIRRGDTESVERMGKYYDIKVLIPEAIKCNPQAEHGEGNEFLNMMENVINNSNSSIEAGLMAVSLTMAMANSK
ncbi:MAG: hypothetical protein K0R54_601 [Clostridiaceae bacterium]|jgi:hypothetical protein|nr:hypothetical protein [Clostridiaceae bacterium]